MSKRRRLVLAGLAAVGALALSGQRHPAAALSQLVRPPCLHAPRRYLLGRSPNSLALLRGRRAGGGELMKRARIGTLTIGAVLCAMAVMATSAMAQTANRTPRITTAAVTPAAGYGAPLTVAFSATATDADGDALTYSWNFGDGGTSTSQNPTHTYQQLGFYNATLTVTDGKGGPRRGPSRSTCSRPSATRTPGSGSWCSRDGRLPPLLDRRGRDRHPQARGREQLPGRRLGGVLAVHGREPRAL